MELLLLNKGLLLVPCSMDMNNINTCLLTVLGPDLFNFFCRHLWITQTFFPSNDLFYKNFCTAQHLPFNPFLSLRSFMSFFPFWTSWKCISSEKETFLSYQTSYNWFVSICALGLVLQTLLTDLKPFIILRYSLICQRVAKECLRRSQWSKSSRAGTTAPKKSGTKPPFERLYQGNPP